MNDLLKLILSMSISGSILAFILYAVRPLVKERFSKAWQYYIWLVVILRLIIPYSPEVSLVGSLFDRAEAVAAEQVTNREASVQRAEMKENIDDENPVQKSDGQNFSKVSGEGIHDYLEYIWVIWISGMLLLLTAKVLQYRRFIYYIRAEACIAGDGEMPDLFRQTRNELGVKREIPLYQSKLIQSPMLVGLLNPAVIIPENSRFFDNLSYVFKHELIHYKRLDIWYKWLVQLTVCIHWFNPLIHVVSRQINSLCEFSCDEAVSKGLDATGKMEYCSTIISVISSGSIYKGNAISMTLCEDKKNLKERLGAILKDGKKSGKIIVLSVILIAVLCCTSIFLGAFTTGVYGRKPLKEPDISPVDAFGMSANPSGVTEPIDNQTYSEKKVIIDPGHGGADAGAVYSDGNDTEIREKELNLKISLLLRDMLEESGVNVELTRQEDRRLTLEDRMELANDLNASLFVSVHYNVSPDRTKQGTLTLYNSSSDNSIYGITGQKTAQLLHDEIINKLGTEDAGVTAMTESLKYDSLKMPAVIVELAFMSNASDRKRLMTEEFDSEAVKALHDGIISVLNEM